MEQVFELDPAAGEAELRVQLEQLEMLKSRIAAQQARVTALWREKRHAAEAAAGVPKSKRGR
ncbi:hypothetical protein MPHL21000_13940 [Mycolicibacterium phlei DSM 43239 = CCUG 21000]|uniref:Uncharacterized protein n=1 Tax=Mycolicibacterium phlei DSM 43239 = CCUG 21000 TaxID=1226750 RepID=A0A5N5V0I8_MYCPH|nr:hypothetical protein [Mycolicibacterium phlei]KAB7755178.1 hypothetical protein MPHL21000_13940 [Mycolicibacterium phlei DSM 43239 = CCUG 21000]